MLSRVVNTSTKKDGGCVWCDGCVSLHPHQVPAAFLCDLADCVSDWTYYNTWSTTWKKTDICLLNNLCFVKEFVKGGRPYQQARFCGLTECQPFCTALPQLDSRPGIKHNEINNMGTLQWGTSPAPSCLDCRMLLPVRKKNTFLPLLRLMNHANTSINIKPADINLPGSPPSS